MVNSDPVTPAAGAMARAEHQEQRRHKQRRFARVDQCERRRDRHSHQDDTGEENRFAAESVRQCTEQRIGHNGYQRGDEYAEKCLGAVDFDDRCAIRHEDSATQI